RFHFAHRAPRVFQLLPSSDCELAFAVVSESCCLQYRGQRKFVHGAAQVRKARDSPKRRNRQPGRLEKRLLAQTVLSSVQNVASRPDGRELSRGGYGSRRYIFEFKGDG